MVVSSAVVVTVVVGVVCCEFTVVVVVVDIEVVKLVVALVCSTVVVTAIHYCQQLVLFYEVRLPNVSGTSVVSCFQAHTYCMLSWGCRLVSHLDLHTVVTCSIVIHLKNY